jgi:hypothetical protein
MKDYREPAIRKQRKISGFNIWQSNWWETYGKGLKLINNNLLKLSSNRVKYIYFLFNLQA